MAEQLHKAAGTGDAATVLRLLESGVPADRPNSGGWTGLHFAAYGGHVGAAAALLQRGKANPNAIDQRGWTPLHIAAQEGRADVIRVLMAQGANPCSRTSNGNMPAHVAAQEGRTPALQALLEGPGVAARSCTNVKGQTLLAAAAFKGRAEVVAYLLGPARVPGEVGLPDSAGDTALHRALNGFRPDRTDQFLATARALLAAGANPGSCNQRGESAYSLAAARGIAPQFAVLVQQAQYSPPREPAAPPAPAPFYNAEAATRANTPFFADADSAATRRNLPLEGPGLLQQASGQVGSGPLGSGPLGSGPLGSGPGSAKHHAGSGSVDLVPMGEELRRAAVEGDLDALKAALRQGGGAVVDQRGPDGATALLLAAGGGFEDAVQELLNAGANAAATSASGDSALHLAVQGGRVAVIQVLLAEGGASDRLDGRGNSALHVAAIRGQAAAVLALLQGGASPNLRNKTDDTALHIAARDGRVGIVAALVNGGASLEVAGAKGATPLMVAAAGGHLAVVKTLVKAGARAEPTDSRGCSALHHAVMGWQQDRGESYTATVRELLLACCDPQADNFRGETALDLARRAGITPLKQLLTEASGGVYLESLRQSIRPKGVRGFWAQAMRNHPLLGRLITPKDAEALQHLSEVHYEFVRGPEKAHRMVFLFFRGNPYFKQQMLVKEYPLVEDAAKIRGTLIDWLPGKALTPGSSALRPGKPLQPGDSFFNFFKVPEVPPARDGVALSPEALSAIQEDCAIAGAIGNILQRAQDWNTGAALEDYAPAGAPGAAGFYPEIPPAALPQTPPLPAQRQAAYPSVQPQPGPPGPYPPVPQNGYPSPAPGVGPAGPGPAYPVPLHHGPGTVPLPSAPPLAGAPYPGQPMPAPLQPHIPQPLPVQPGPGQQLIPPPGYPNGGGQAHGHSDSFGSAGSGAYASAGSGELVSYAHADGMQFQSSLPVAELVRSIKPVQGADSRAVAALGVGRAAMVELRFGSALRDFSTIIEDENAAVPVRAEAALGRCAAALKMFRPKEAAKDAALVQALAPSDARGFVAEGLARMATKDYRMAKKAFKQAMQLDPDYPDVYEMVHNAKDKISGRNKKRLDTVKQFIGPVIGLGVTLLTL